MTHAEEVPTTQGLARVRWHRAASGAPIAGTLLLGHGAGGQKDSAEVTALAGLSELGWQVGLVDQPWRVAGKKLGPGPALLDRAWLEVMASIGALPRPLVHGGRSAGARVVCRSASSLPAALQPDALLLVSFPLHPPGRPEKTRALELTSLPNLPTAVVQGLRDPFGSPDKVRTAIGDGSASVIPVAGTHSPSPQETHAVVAAWLADRVVARETLGPMEHLL